jgi:divalent metal cation (Fe/Co/Zn/Cd) transporter
VVAGIISHSQGLIADGLHSLSDLVCDFPGPLCCPSQQGSCRRKPSLWPRSHRNGSVVCTGSDSGRTGAGIIWSAGVKLQDVDNLPPVAPLALWTAILALAAKEGLFRYMLHVGERLRSPMLIANAWHARSDAASSLVVALGIVGNLMGYSFADSVAAVIVGFMIVRMGVVFAWDALQELIDTGLVGRGSRQHPPGDRRHPRGQQSA